MCLLFLYFNPTANPGEYKLILANNRDEYYHRPAKTAHFWPSAMDVIGGTDQEKGKEGGTWFAMNRNGKLSCVLNILQPHEDVDPTKKGKGFLVNDFVLGHSTLQEYSEQLEKEASEYNGFLLVTMDAFPECPSVSYYTNKSEDNPQVAAPGIHVFGNSTPSRLWEKATKGKVQFEELLNEWNTKKNKQHLVNGIFKMLKNTTTYPVDDLMERQGKGLPRYVLERMNATFCSIPERNLGTRSHTIVLVDGSNNVEYLESSMEQPIDIKGIVNWVDKQECFSLRRPELRIL